MKKDLLDISENMSYNLLLNSAISFKPFAEHLRSRINEEKTMRADFYKQMLSKFDQYLNESPKITIESIPKYEGLCELLYTCVSPFSTNESACTWGLCFPFRPFIFYGTDTLYKLFINEANECINKDFFSKPAAVYRAENLQRIYSFILQRLYGFEGPLKNDAFCTCADPVTGLDKYYEVNFDTQFVEVFTKGELPNLDLKELYIQLHEGAGYEILENILPLDIFQFRGISMVTVRDVTREYALESIKNSWVTYTAENEIDNYNDVIQSLKMLAGSNSIEFELFPFFRINNKMVYAYEKGRPSILNSVWGEKRLSPERFHVEAQGYSSNANFFFSKNIREEKEDHYKMAELFKPYDVCSLALKPIFLNNKPVGVLGMYTKKSDRFNENALSLVEEAIPSLAQLLQVYIDEFNLEIEDIIKEKFTSIQSAVQWKFNEVAWRFLYNKKKHITSTETAPIIFNNVYPLYGAVDIRDSTVERNVAIKADLQSQLTLLSKTFARIQQHHPSSLLDEMIFKCQKWLDHMLSERGLKANEETHLNNFLTHETIPFLKHLMQDDSRIKPAVEDYLLAINEDNGEVFRNKRALELSMQMINTHINHYLELEKKELQTDYPCYFEKFKTDGIEYDIYIGQSMAPEKPFNHFHVKNLRLWQLKSMAAMAKITHALLPEMPHTLHTTQLIFVHGKTIDISFRNDERRFDVEGAYNIRYQMIKKRIDKVCIRNSKERLTQPGKIALVYLNKRDIEDYLTHIYYLQEIKILENTLEELDLEDLQGINGLKALRVGVNYG